MHVLNSSATEVHWIAFAGHSFSVIALDGNALAEPVSVSMLRLAPAERVSAIVEMNNPRRMGIGRSSQTYTSGGHGHRR